VQCTGICLVCAKVSHKYRNPSLNGTQVVNKVMRGTEASERVVGERFTPTKLTFEVRVRIRRELRSTGSAEFPPWY